MANININSTKGKVQKCETHGKYNAKGVDFFGEVIYSRCPECTEEKEKAEQVRQAQRQAADYTQWKEQSNMPERYKSARLKDAGKLKNEYRLVTEWLKSLNHKPDQTLILCGHVGTGKTRLACALLNGIGAGEYIRLAQISREIRSSYSSNETTEEQIFKRLTTQKILVIDEVGVQSGTEAESRIVTEIIDVRYSEMIPTVVVSNLTTSELSQQFGERAWDRLSSCATVIPMTGKSLRAKHE